MKVESFVKILKEAGFFPFMGVPCSVFKFLLNYIDNSKEVENYLCSSEGEAMGLSAGFAISGKMPVVYMQNDGYGNAVNPLSSLQLLYKLPALLLISWRAEPGKKDAPQHYIMGKTILRLLDVFEIPYIILKDDIANLENSVMKAKEYCKHNSAPIAFIIKKGYFEKYEKIISKSVNTLNKRIEYIKLLANNVSDNDILLGATGFCGRELYQSIKHKGKFYMMGSMGCLSAIGLGIAKENPNRNIFVLDGDGALLMKMGTLSTIGYYQPKNLIHICFDNNKYESTGGQPTTSITTGFSTIAKACGYKSIDFVTEIEDFQKILENIKQYEKPHFIHIKVKTGTIECLERPSDSPEDMRENLMEFLSK
ncbi:MAG: phosphonopyruvate decarboxylase [Candidatus Cloacimonetes bacterium]|nr:phosphonopyruvate decarboxylase [Candidatus Cloacimonadota bacterium]